MSQTLVMAGGGTGGHVFPLLAVADVLRALAPSLRLVFVGTERGLERTLVPERGYELETLQVHPIRGGGFAGAANGVKSAALAVFKARSLLGRLKPRAVFSVGGYAAGPVALAAFTARIPLALLEPNADIGLANRWVAPLVSRAYVGFPEARRFFRESTVVETGVPLRAGFTSLEPRPNDGTVRILVLGGSQGAKTLNESVPRALARLNGNVRVVHQCGRAHLPETEKLYAELSMHDRAVVTPFIDDVPRALADADLVIGRAGASAVSEICLVGRPSVLVPYPFAGDHQRFNALSLEQRGAARCVLAGEATVERLERELVGLLESPERLREMGERARALGKPHAAESIARDLLELAGLGVEVGKASRPGEDAAGERGRLTYSEVV
ncbi:MAG TPA: undecaprenyldiphospho-muramoylpentapeptide beta-N-acetylglucosaminyltransferase [Polyangiaceae bacterium]|nr:undecaprenyldiphospho-muramoylpentapeptide beta-N-acetylglucosaminyltransferase [Polyangiaceae bacterium]